MRMVFNDVFHRWTGPSQAESEPSQQCISADELPALINSISAFITCDKVDEDCEAPPISRRFLALSQSTQSRCLLLPKQMRPPLNQVFKARLQSELQRTGPVRWTCIREKTKTKHAYLSLASVRL